MNEGGYMCVGLPCMLDPLWCSLFLGCYKKLLDCRFGIRRRSGLVAIAILLFRIPISSSLIRPPFSTSGYRAALCRTWALGGDVAGLTTLVAVPGLLTLGAAAWALSGDVSVLATVVALSGSAVATATTTASGSGSAVSGEVTNTATGVASSGLATTVATTTTTAVVASDVTGLWAVSGLVTWLTTSVALATAGEAASGSTGTGALGALGGKVSLLTTGVAGSGLGGWALFAQVSLLATRVAGGGAAVGAGASDVAGLATVEAVSSSRHVVGSVSVSVVVASFVVSRCSVVDSETDGCEGSRLEVGSVNDRYGRSDRSDEPTR